MIGNLRQISNLLRAQLSGLAGGYPFSTGPIWLGHPGIEAMGCRVPIVPLDIPAMCSPLSPASAAMARQMTWLRRDLAAGSAGRSRREVYLQRECNEDR